MNHSATVSRLTIFMSFCYLVFAAACTFSIALAQTALGLAAVSFIILAFLNRKELFKDSPGEIYAVLFAFVGWTALTSCLGAGGLGGLADIQSYWLFLAFPVGWHLLRSNRYRDKLLTVLAVVVLIGGLASLIQFFSGISWPGVSPPVPSRTWGFRAQGFFSSRMTYAQVMVPFALMFLYLGWSGLKSQVNKARHKLYFAAGIMGAVGILLSLSRASIVALVFGLLLIGLMLGRKQLLVIVALLIATALLSWRFVPDLALRFENTTKIDLRSYKVAGRLFIWEKSWSIVKDNPWLGVGQSRFQAEYIKRLDYDFDDDRIPGDAHSDWLHTAAISGFPGLFFLAWLWIAVLHRAINDIRREKERTVRLAALVGLAGVLVMSLAVSLFEDSEMLQVIILMWVIVLSGSDTRPLDVVSSDRANNQSEE